MEADWKRFRKRVPEWRERYLTRMNGEIIALLTDTRRTPTERFWDAQQRMEEEAEILVTCLDGHSRSKMQGYLLLMHRHGFIEEADLEEFSDEVRAPILASARALEQVTGGKRGG